MPRPSPLLAPFTNPAMSTISQVAGTIRPGCTISASFVNRSSGTVITPRFGSIVQKGKLAACALALDRQLKRVDLPTLGKPTIPHFNDMSLSFIRYILVAKLQNIIERHKEIAFYPKLVIRIFYYHIVQINPNDQFITIYSPFQSPCKLQYSRAVTSLASV